MVSTLAKTQIQCQLPEFSAVFSSVTATRDLTLSAPGAISFTSAQEIDTSTSKNKSVGVDIGVTLSASGLSPNASLNLGKGNSNGRDVTNIESVLTAGGTSIIGPNVQLHHNKIFIKQPEKGSPFPMHQDYHYFPHAENTMTAAILHFDDAPIEKGCLRVVPGSHLLGPLDPVGEDRHLPGYAIEDAKPIPAKAGDVIFFNYLLIHGSGLNLSDEARTTLLVQMRDPQDRATIERHLSRGQGMMLAGINSTPSAK